jgi:hypothetical protein
MSDRDRFALNRVVEELEPKALAWLEEAAALSGFSDQWPKIPPLLELAHIWATVALAHRLQAEFPRWGWSRCLDQAEDALLTPEARAELDGNSPKSVRMTLHRWKAAPLDRRASAG